MDAIYILTGLCTVVLAVGGLILTCHLERRALTSRRHQGAKPPVGTGPENSQLSA